MAVTINGNGVVTGLDSEGSSDLNTKLEAAGGLVMVTPTTIANSGGTATLTSGAVAFSGVTSVSLNGCFTSAFANYKVVLTMATSASGAVNLRLRKVGVDNSTANNDIQFTSFNNTTLVGTRSTTQTSYFVMTNAGIAQQQLQTNIEIAGPQASQATRMQNIANYITTSNSTVSAVSTGYHNVVDQFDGFTIYADPTALSTGTIRCYGYRNGI